MADAISLKDISGVCRACLHKKPPEDFANLLTEPTRRIFIKSTNVYIEEDGRLPMKLCMTCIAKCVDWLEFREMVENNDKLLRTITVSEDLTEDNDCIAKVETIQVDIEADTVEDMFEPKKEDPTMETENNIDMLDDHDPATDDDDMVVARFEEIKDPAPRLVEETSMPPTIHKGGEEPILNCPVKDCNRQFTGFKNFGTHCVTHVVSKRIVCPICQCPYERMENYRNHMYVHLNQQFQCPHCDRLFSRPKTLHDHIRDAHLQYARKNLDDLLREEEQVVLPPVVDPGSSKAKKSRKRAATTADNEEDEGASVSANFSDAFMNSLKTSETKCPVCGRSCDSFKSFEEHIFTHISRLNRSCPLCQQQFKRFDNLKCHMYSHTDITFKCTNCPKEFVNPKTYSKHIREVHLNKLVRNDNMEETCCAYCGKSFTQSGTLREHLKTHTLEKKYPCTECGEAFAMKVTLRDHMSEKHADTLEATKPAADPVECPLCRKMFRNKKERNAHIEKNHSSGEPGLCNICGEFTGSAQELKGHILVKHSEVDETGTLFTCKECNKTFNKAFRLKDHQKCHNRERRFACDLCGFAFITVQNLESHMRTVHKIGV